MIIPLTEHGMGEDDNKNRFSWCYWINQLKVSKT